MRKRLRWLVLATALIGAALVSGAVAADAPGPFVITTIGGTGTSGYSGDRGPATSAKFGYPTGAAIDSKGNVYVADHANFRIRKITPAGTVTTIAGNGNFARGPAVTRSGIATKLPLDLPNRVAVDKHGNVYFTGSNFGEIQRITPAGKMTTIAGTGIPGYSGDGGPAKKAQFFAPGGIAVDGEGNVYVCDYSNYRVRKITPAGRITTVAGTGKPGFSGDGGPATKAQINEPQDVAVDAQGNLYIADARNFRVRKVTPGGIIGTIAGNGGNQLGNIEGEARDVPLGYPDGVAVDKQGIVYVTTPRIVFAVTGSKLRRIAGLAGAAHIPPVVGDGGSALLAELGTLFAVAVDGKGAVYFVDMSQSRIRKLTPK